MQLITPLILGVGLSIAALGCGSQSKEPPTRNGTADDAKPEPPPEVVATETPPPPAPETNPGGPNAAELVQCSAESRRAEMCTQQFDPVCADLDTGVRCIKAPCPASERKTFSNACMACKEANVMAYRKGSCEGGDKATH